MDKIIEQKNRCYGEIRDTPIEYQGGLRKRLQSGEFDRCGPHGLYYIRLGLKYYPEFSDRILKQDYSKMTGAYVQSYIHRLIPGFTTTPVTDALQRSLEGYLEISKRSMQMTATLDNYPLNKISRLRREETLFDVSFLKEKIDSWLKQEPEKLSLGTQVVDAEAHVVDSDGANTNAESNKN